MNVESKEERIGCMYLRRVIRNVSILCLCIFVIFVCAACHGQLKMQVDTFEDIVKEFQQPPCSAGVRCFWWWLNGNVTKQAITRDLEQMKAKGFSGALIVDAGGADQRNNRQVPAGPMFASPEWTQLFVHAVQEANRLGLELSLNIQSGWNLGGPPVTPEMAAKTLTWSEVEINGPRQVEQKLPVPGHVSNYYRDIAVLAYPLKYQSPRSTARPTRRPIRDLEKKAVFEEIGWAAPDCRFLLEDVPAVEGEEDALLEDVVDLTDNLSEDGTLSWQVPSGRWIVLRFGYTLNGVGVSTYSGNWKGHVIDYMDADIFKSYWDMVVVPLLDEIGPHVGTTLKYLSTDSWECGGANWTRHFQREFLERRGYDITAYLPIIAGKIIENRDVSNRFLADFRKTVGDCVADNHYGIFAELSHARGLGVHPESGGPHAGPFDAIKCMGRSDIALGEFWVPSPHRSKLYERFYTKQTSSVAHIYGLKYVAAEAFTSIGPHWEDVLWSSQKPTFEHELCSGLNLCFIHTFTCSPVQMGIPGQEYFAGTHFNPNVTWWEYAGAFLDYIHRCQFLVQQGTFVADVLYYQGDHVPNLVRLKEADPGNVLPGYDYDVVNEEILLGRTSVKDRRIYLDSGMQYRILVLPDHKVLSLAALEKVKQLVADGAVVFGEKPVKTVSLENYPDCDYEFKMIADHVWGLEPDSSGQNIFGKGMVIWGRDIREVLMDLGLEPDFAVNNPEPDDVFDYIHYKICDADMYFVCNQTARQKERICTFRISGRQPELWDPLTGQIRDANAFTQANGKTEIPLLFSPYGCWFVIFHKSISLEQQGTGQTNYPVVEPVRSIAGSWQVGFDPAWGGPEQVQFDELTSWTESFDPGIKYYSGKGIYNKTFDYSGTVDTGKRYWLDLGDVKDTGIASVQFNGGDLGVLWTKPFRVEITGLLKSGQNELVIEVINSWRNRLVGDRNLPAEECLTQTNIRTGSGWQLLESGLLGPVQILSN
jgi:hypothetical protein